MNQKSDSRKLTAAMFAFSDVAAVVIGGLSVIGFVASPFLMPVYYEYELPGQQPAVLDIAFIMAAYVVQAVFVALHLKRRPVCLGVLAVLLSGFIVAQYFFIASILLLIFVPPWLLTYREVRQAAPGDSA